MRHRLLCCHGRLVLVATLRGLGWLTPPAETASACASAAIKVALLKDGNGIEALIALRRELNLAHKAEIGRLKADHAVALSACSGGGGGGDTSAVSVLGAQGRLLEAGAVTASGTFS